MKCEECEYRFLCYTLANTERPQRVTVNWKITASCGKCQHSKFGTSTQGSRVIQNPAGYCEKMNAIVHKESAICNEENYMPRKIANIDKVYKEIREVLGTKNRRTKLPKYCVIEE